MHDYRLPFLCPPRLLTLGLFLLALILLGIDDSSANTGLASNVRRASHNARRIARRAPAGVVILRCTGGDDTAALETSVTAAQGKTIVITNGQSCAARDITIPNLRIEKGGLLKPLSSHTVTLSGRFEAGPYQSFTNALAGQGTISFAGNRSVEAINVQWWGATARLAADQAKDDTRALQAAFSSGATRITIPDGHYMIDAVTVQPGHKKPGLNLVSNTELSMGKNTFLHVRNNSSISYNLLVGWKVANVIVRGGNLVGDNVTNSRAPDGNPGGFGLALFGVSNVRVYEVTSQNMFADGFFICYDDEAGPHPESENVHLIDCIGYRNYRQGASIVGAKNGSIEGGKYYETSGSPPQDGIDIEPNADIHGPGLPSLVTDFVVQGVVAAANKGSGIEVNGTSGPDSILRVELINNRVYSNGDQGIVYSRNANHGKIIGNTTNGNAKNGISVYQGANIDVADNESYGNGQGGIMVQNPSGETRYVNVRNNTCRDNGTGIILTAADGRTVSDVSLTNNTCIANLWDGISLDRGVNVKCDGNIVTGNSQASDNAADNITITNCTRCSVSHNTIRRGVGAKQPRYGINLSASTDTIVRDNDLVTAGKLRAINDAATRSNVSGNKLAETPIRQ
jgi:hypothetical protein